MKTQVMEVESAADGQQMAKQTLFKVGWNYDTFLRRNSIVPSSSAQEEWLALSREHSKLHCEDVMRLVQAGCKTKVKTKAVFNRGDGRFDTALGVIVIKPGCSDSELITEALLGARKRFAKTLEVMEAAAQHQGVIA